MPIEVLRIPALTDNYIWLLHDTESDACVVVDPAEADAVLTAANARGWRIGEIWNTHWHPDHTGGNAAIKAATGAIVRAPAAEAARIPTIDVALNDGDEVAFGAHRAAVRAVPGGRGGTDEAAARCVVGQRHRTGGQRTRLTVADPGGQ